MVFLHIIFSSFVVFLHLWFFFVCGFSSFVVFLRLWVFFICGFSSFVVFLHLWFFFISGFFYICGRNNLYPSITESLLINSLNFALKNINVLKKEVDLISHSRRSLLYSYGIPWVKKKDENFDVAMGAYDGAGVCE